MSRTSFALLVLILSFHGFRQLQIPHRMYHLTSTLRHLNNNPELKFLFLMLTKVNVPALHLGSHLMITSGKPPEKQTASAAILYDPDSADDIDDDDPDEDLDI